MDVDTLGMTTQEAAERLIALCGLTSVPSDELAAAIAALREQDFFYHLVLSHIEAGRDDLALSLIRSAQGVDE